MIIDIVWPQVILFYYASYHAKVGNLFSQVNVIYILFLFSKNAFPVDWIAHAHASMDVVCTQGNGMLKEMMMVALIGSSSASAGIWDLGVQLARW